MELIEGILKLIIEIFKTIFEIFGMAFKKKGSYSAAFAGQGRVLSYFNKGFCLTGKRNLTVKNSYQNALIMGSTGTGKSSVVLIPSLYTMLGSFVIHDPSGELFYKSAGYLKQKGYEIKVLNFTNPDKSSGYNPLTRIQSNSDVQKVASMLIETALGGKTKDPFWNTQATSLLAMLITILRKQGGDFFNLFNVRQLLNKLGGDPESVDALFSEFADDILFAEYKSFTSYDEKVISGVVATCKASLNIFSDDSVARVTSYDNLDFIDFRNKPTALFIQNSVADQKYYSVLTSLFFEQFFSFLLGRFPNDKEQHIFLLIDECSSLNLPTLPLAVANVRKHRAGAILLLQDFNQLVHHYGKYEADAIRSNCFAKMYFTGASHETATELEKILGKYEFEDDKKRTVVRPLMTNDEIRTMQMNQALLICGHHPPIKARLRPYYKSFKFRAYSQIPSPLFGQNTLPDEIPVIPLKSN